MLRGSAILLLFCGSLIPAYHAQLAKLPSLAGHYLHHLEEHGDITVIDFLALHYGEAATHHNGEEDHSDLPFFQISHTHLLVIGPEMHKLDALPATPLSAHPVVHSEKEYANVFLGGIFQPPRRG